MAPQLRVSAQVRVWNSFSITKHLIHSQSRQFISQLKSHKVHDSQHPVLNNQIKRIPHLCCESSRIMECLAYRNNRQHLVQERATYRAGVFSHLGGSLKRINLPKAFTSASTCLQRDQLSRTVEHQTLSNLLQNHS